MPGRLQVFHSLNEITKIEDHFRRAAGQIDSWNLGFREPIDDPINCVPRHDFLALWPSVHVAMHAGEIAEFAHVDLKNFRTRATKHDVVLSKAFSKSVHKDFVTQ